MPARLKGLRPSGRSATVATTHRRVPNEPRRALRDARSGRIVALSHCLLNENVRYLGGATRSGGVDEIVDAARDAGVGICQLPCPEQQTWGGVLKPWMLLICSADRHGLARLRRGLMPALVAYTRWRYRRLARRVVDGLADYDRAGFVVVGIVGVDGSPSCGVRRTLDIDRAVEAFARCDPISTDARDFNERVVVRNQIPGAGWFSRALQEELRRRRVAVPLYAHDLIAELAGARDIDRRLRGELLGQSGRDRAQSAAADGVALDPDR